MTASLDLPHPPCSWGLPLSFEDCPQGGREGGRVEYFRAALTLCECSGTKFWYQNSQHPKARSPLRSSVRPAHLKRVWILQGVSLNNSLPISLSNSFGATWISASLPALPWILKATDNANQNLTMR